jgi:eukaryotic-like serine/threonine-protein kinase
MSKTTRSAPTEHPRLGKYEVLREVGRSTTAIVYEGHDPYIDRPVALKMAQKRLPTSRDLAERFRRRFFREAQTVGGLRHPNIVQVFDAGVHGDRCYIVMEYVSHGATLQPYAQADHLLPIERVVEAAFQLPTLLPMTMSPSLQRRVARSPNITLSPRRMPRLESPRASSKQPSATTT